MPLLTIEKFSHTAVRVSNADATLDFYRATVGIEVLKDIKLEGGFGRAVVCVFSDGTGVEFIELNGADGKAQAVDGSVDTAMMALSVADIEQAYQTLKDKGYSVTEPFAAAGVKLMMLQDPDGRNVEIAQFGSASSAADLQRQQQAQQQ
jgi:catechol 2,3-dioxygenase-like lactoylglutathione lyase family enzyme